MKNEFTQDHVGLRLMVTRISASSLPSATRKNSFIINDVPADLQANTDEQMLATIFGSLLNTIITHTENCCIRISAIVCGKIVLLHLKETQRLNTAEFAGNLRQLQVLAEKIGGTVSISHSQNEATTVGFSFMNNFPLAA
jgi:hypothetical protein